MFKKKDGKKPEAKVEKRVERKPEPKVEKAPIVQPPLTVLEQPLRTRKPVDVDPVKVGDWVVYKGVKGKVWEIISAERVIVCLETGDEVIMTERDLDNLARA